MAPFDTIIKDAIQVLSNPAWTGIGVLTSSVLSYMALRNSRQPHTHPHILAFKKNVNWSQTDNISVPIFSYLLSLFQ